MFYSQTQWVKECSKHTLPLEKYRGSASSFANDETQDP